MAQPQPPTCEPWCTCTPGWVSTPGGTDQTCCCDLVAGTDVDGDSVHVRLIRPAFLEDGRIEVGPTRIQVDCVGMLDHLNAITLAGRLTDASRLAAS